MPYRTRKPKYIVARKKRRGGVAPAVVAGLAAASPAIASVFNNVIDWIRGKGRMHKKRRVKRRK